MIQNSTARLTYQVFSAGVLTDANAVTLMIKDPDGIDIWQAVKTATRETAGTYYVDIATTDTVKTGRYQLVWTVTLGTGTLTDTEFDEVDMVEGSWSNPGTVRRELAPTDTVKTDAELQSFIDQAQSVVRQAIGGQSFGRFNATIFPEAPGGSGVLYIPPDDVHGRINSIDYVGVDISGLGLFYEVAAGTYKIIEDECAIEIWLAYARVTTTWPPGNKVIKITGNFGTDIPDDARRAVTLLATRNILAGEQTRHEKERDFDLADQGYTGADPTNAKYTTAPTGVPEVDRLIAVLKTRKQPAIFGA